MVNINIYSGVHCAGKTTSINLYKTKLEKQNIKFKLLPENKWLHKYVDLCTNKSGDTDDVNLKQKSEFIAKIINKCLIIEMFPPSIKEIIKTLDPLKVPSLHVISFGFYIDLYNITMTIIKDVIDGVDGAEIMLMDRYMYDAIYYNKFGEHKGLDALYKELCQSYTLLLGLCLGKGSKLNMYIYDDLKYKDCLSRQNIRSRNDGDISPDEIRYNNIIKIIKMVTDEYTKQLVVTLKSSEINIIRGMSYTR